MRVGEAEGDPEGDGRRTLANRWESQLWRLEDKHLREGSSVRQFGRPCPLRIRHRRRRSCKCENLQGDFSNDPKVRKLFGKSTLVHQPVMERRLLLTK